MSKLEINPFDSTLATLKADWPEQFTLQVDEWAFRDVGSVENAIAIKHSMEGMKWEAAEMGYDVTTLRNPMEGRWEYRFKLRPGVKRPVAPDDTLEVAIIPLGENSE